jgi:hypothetical protein
MEAVMFCDYSYKFSAKTPERQVKFWLEGLENVKDYRGLSQLLPE